jgi:pimeloyl-ACP methyl ester carboxylesterase
MGACGSNSSSSGANGAHKNVPASTVDIQRHKGKSCNGTNYIFQPSENANMPTVVCVHGIGSFGADFELICKDFFSIGYSVLRYDLLGRGFSDYPADGKFDGPAHVQQLRNLVVDLKISGTGAKYHIIGHSMGGALVTIYAAEYMKEIASITLLTPAGLMDKGLLPVIRGSRSTFGTFAKVAIVKPSQLSAWRRGYLKPATNANAVRVVAELQEVNRTNIRQFDAFWGSVLQFPLYGIDDSVRLFATSAESDVSVHVVWAEKDDVVPYSTNYTRWKRLLLPSEKMDEPLLEAQTVELKSRLLRFTVVESLKHAFMLENPELVNPLLVQFVRKVDDQYAAVAPEDNTA